MQALCWLAACKPWHLRAGLEDSRTGMAAQHLHSRVVVSQLQVHLEQVQLLLEPSYSSTIRSPRSTSRSRSTRWYSARLRVTTVA